MTALYPTDLLNFTRQFKFAGGRIRRVQLINRNGDDPAIEMVIAVRMNAKSLGEKSDVQRLKLRFTGVEEFRFQKRPGTPSGKISDCRFGYFQDLFFVTFDAWGLPAGETPKVHDFRASDAYIASRDLKWELVEKAASTAAPAKK